MSDYGQAADGTVYPKRWSFCGQTLSERLAAVATDGQRAPYS